MTGVLPRPDVESLMSYLPPVGWADVATRRDLEALESRLGAEVERALNSRTRTLFFSLAGLMVTLTASVAGALTLA